MSAYGGKPDTHWCGRKKELLLILVWSLFTSRAEEYQRKETKNREGEKWKEQTNKKEKKM